MTARSDVYSLGCVLYHCLTGRMPYERETDVAVIYAHLSEDPPKPSVVRPELPSGLDGVIAKALDKSPDRRFESAGDLMTAARGAVDAVGPLSETIAPRTPSQSRGASTEVGAAIEGMREVAAAARRSRVLLAGVDASTRAIAKVALGGRVDVQETASAGALDVARDVRPDLVILGAADIMSALRADPVDA